MSRIPESSVREIRDQVDIVGLIGRYVELKKAGSNHKGLCPFHNEKSPSFNVNSERQIFHCFGCDEGGDAIAFLMRHEGLSFPEAARNLAAENGIEIPEDQSSQPSQTAAIFAANEIAQSLYCDALASAEGAKARAYLQKRGLDGESIARFGIGYAPDRWDAVAGALDKAGIRAQVGEAAGLLAPRRSGGGHYDRLRGRISFPIQDVRGRCVGFGGRALDPEQEPKYLNTPESPVFHKRQSFYGFPLALEGIRRASRAIVCEGYFDRIALHRAELGEGLATCGTALTPDHAAQLRRRTQEIVLLFDGDAAGEKAVERALEVLLPHGLRVSVVSLPAGEDPDTFLVTRGADALRQLVDSSANALEVVIQRSLSQGWATPTAKADIVDRMSPLLRLIPNRIERDEYVRRLALAVDSDVASVAAVVRSGGRGRAEAPVEAVVDSVTPRRLSPEERHLRDLAIVLYRQPQLATSYGREKFNAILPEGSWKAIANLLLDAAEAGRINESGAVDLFGIEDHLDDGARARLREIAVSESLSQSDTPLESVLEALVQRFAKRRLDLRMKDLTRRMREPGADTDALLREKQRLSDEARTTRASI